MGDYENFIEFMKIYMQKLNRIFFLAQKHKNMRFFMVVGF